MKRIVIVIAALIIDTLIGDPALICHPVRLIGSSVSYGEKIMRRLFPGAPYIGGMLLSVSVCALSFLVPFFIINALSSFNIILSLILQTFLCYRFIAAKCLKDEALRIYGFLAKGDIVSARKYLSYIVGRDTENLDAPAITRAVIETVAENTSDGVTAPVFYFMIGGVPLMALYKAVNTLDSMIGYKNDKYIDFGRFAAKTDDVFNFIPSRLTGLAMIAAAKLCGYDAANAFYIFKRDRHKHASPNSANTEAAVAGALGIRLAGNAYYFGKLHEKPYIGDEHKPVEAEDIKRTVKLMYISTAITMAFLCAVFALCFYLIQII